MRCGFYFYPRPPRGGRHVHKGHPRRSLSISIHALREEGDTMGTALHGHFRIFLSTPSARRATKSTTTLNITLRDFYPRPPRGGRRIEDAAGDVPGGISIHALREEGDQVAAVLMVRHDISIHALREEGDQVRRDQWRVQMYFYPRPPRGGRHIVQVCKLGDIEFLSTPSARRATFSRRSGCVWSTYFYPRPPRGGRQQKQRQNLYFQTNCTTFCTNLEEP